MSFGGFTWVGPYLASLLEPLLRTLGSREELGKWLRSKDFREEIKDVLCRGEWGVGHIQQLQLQPELGRYNSHNQEQEPGPRQKEPRGDREREEN